MPPTMIDGPWRAPSSPPEMPMPMKVSPLSASSREAPHRVAEIGVAGIDDDVVPAKARAQQRDLLVDRLAGLHHKDDRTRRPDGRRELGDAVARHDRSLERAGAVANASVRAGVRLKTAMRWPFSAMLSARFEPITPRPISPMSAVSILRPRSLLTVSLSACHGRARAAAAMIDGCRTVRQPRQRVNRLAPAAVELQPVVHDVVAELAGDLVLQLLDAVRLELDDVAGLDVDEMVVMLAAGVLETRRAALEGVAVDRAKSLPAASSSGRPSTARSSRRSRRRAERSPARRDGLPSSRADADDDAPRPGDAHALRGAARFS